LRCAISSTAKERRSRVHLALPADTLLRGLCLARAQVQYEGVDYNLRVLELQPAPAVSVIETDIAADVGPSIETEGYLRAQAEAAAREAERQRQAQEQAERQAAEVGAPGCQWGVN
jgi:hypothetical protein